MWWLLGAIIPAVILATKEVTDWFKPDPITDSIYGPPDERGSQGGTGASTWSDIGKSWQQLLSLLPYILLAGAVAWLWKNVFSTPSKQPR